MSHGGYACGAHPRLLRSMSWRWSPERCKLHEFDAGRFRELLKGRTLWFLGDSISICMAASLNCLGIANRNERLDGLGLGAKSGEFTPIDGWLGKNFVRSLDLRTKWAKIFEHLKIGPQDVIVFNTGAHQTDRDERLQRYGDLAQAQADLHAGLLFFRLTIFGHKDCEQYDGPIQPITPEMYQVFTENMYNWGSFRVANAAMIDSFQRAAADRFHVLDVSMFEMRPDGHISQVYHDITNATESPYSQYSLNYRKKDCLHYCVPGPIDTWNYLLYHHLMVLREQGRW